MKDKGYSHKSQNHNVNGGPTRGGGSPKSTTDGKDTSGNATNVIAKWGYNPPEASPSSTSFSKNKGRK